MPALGATIAEKCDALVDELNARRDPNVRLRTILCEIAHSRSLQQAKGIRGPKGDGHWIAYVVYRLDRAGIRWCNVGEAIAWTTARYTLSADYASRFVGVWRSSPNHWPMLSSSSYQQAGGSFRASLIGDGRTYATLLVLRVPRLVDGRWSC